MSAMVGSGGVTRILGVDPGTRATGWGVVDLNGRNLQHIAHGIIRTKASDPLWERLQTIHSGLSTIIADHAPAMLSLERCFVSKNVRSALFLGHARGAIMVACTAAGMGVAEYAPTEIKSAVAGSGRADKAQVAAMVRMILSLPKVPASDAADALGAAICHAHARPMIAAKAQANSRALAMGGRR